MKTYDAFISARISGCRDNFPAIHPPVPILARLNYDPPSEVPRLISMKQTLQLKLSQHLTLTPQLQQSIRLLQLSTMELNQELEKFWPKIRCSSAKTPIARFQHPRAHEWRAGYRPSGARGGREHGDPIADGHFLG